MNEPIYVISKLTYVNNYSKIIPEPPGVTPYIGTTGGQMSQFGHELSYFEIKYPL
jgi:hypothetical protein